MARKRKSQTTITLDQVIPVSPNEQGYKQVKVITFDRYHVKLKGRKSNSGRFSTVVTEWSRRKLHGLRLDLNSAA